MSDIISDDGFSSDALGPDGESSSGVASLGRISGKLLKSNLTRNGIPLAFETNLLYLDVNTDKVGINTLSPTESLHISGTTNTTNMRVEGTQARIDNVIFRTNGTITTLAGGALHIVPTGGPSIVIEHERVITDSLDINDNYIAGLIPGRDFQFRPNGTGQTNFNANSIVNGDVNVTGNIYANTDVNVKGYVTVGDQPYDTVTVNTDFTQSIIPGDDVLYDLGTNLKRWKNIYFHDNNLIDAFVSTTATISDQVYIAGNTISTLQSNDPLFVTSDEGTVTLESISIKDNTITNLLDSKITFSHTGNGYLRFAGSFGVLVPAGTDLERVGYEVGDTRWNTDRNYLECFDGTVWEVSTGGGATVTQEFMQDLGHQYTLIFG